MSKKRSTLIGTVAALFVIVIVLVYGGLWITRNIGKSSQEVSEDDAKATLEKVTAKIKTGSGSGVRSAVDYTEETDSAAELPDIDTCEVVVRSETPLYVEIFSSPEKAGSGTDGWLTELAEQFNEEAFEIDGQPVSVQIRNVNSGQMIDYIATGAAVPDAFTPSSSLWGNMLNAKSVKTETIMESMVGNVAGIVLQKSTYNQLLSDYGTIDLKTVVDATAAGEFTMGYTNPFASTAGMNFLISTLLRYDAENPLSETAEAGFAAFQANVPFVSLTTMQMRTAADKGTLDGFIMEYQTYVNDSTLSKNYQFTPYGYRHDNPLIMISGINTEKEELLRMFADYCSTDSAKTLAKKYGFGQMDSYSCEYEEQDCDVLLAAQQYYKTAKDSGKPVICVFVADVSGSMAGDPIVSLKNSLLNSMQYISTDNYIGLVSYASSVTRDLEIGQFKLDQQSLFKGAVENLNAGGNTATYDAVLIAAKMIEDKLEVVPDARTMIIVLSDGVANSGNDFKTMKSIIEGLSIPVYTIAYGEGADTETLSNMANINEAAALNASSQDIVYQLKQMFNAAM
ncbi:MAG: VWA domain-containing protein [Clostridiales bacterium]|nr:VWA domain-containing protein [Clostridiales bacterium]